MSQPGSPIDICNLALDRLGQAPVVNILTPTSVYENVMARQYDQTRRELLREYIFNFARKVVLLTRVRHAPKNPEFHRAYTLPADLVRLLTIGDRILFGGNIPTQFFTISQNFLYCDDMTRWDFKHGIDSGHDENDGNDDDDDDQVDSDNDTPEEDNPTPPDSDGDGDSEDDELHRARGLQIEYVSDFTTVPLMDPTFIKALKLQLAANVAYKFTLKQSLVDGLLKELDAAILKAAAVSGQEKPPRRVQRSRIRDVRRSGGIFRNNTVI